MEKTDLPDELGTVTLPPEELKRIIELIESIKAGAPTYPIETLWDGIDAE